MAAFSLVAGLSGRLLQWGQQVSAVMAARARDSTAVKLIWPGARLAVAAARAARAAIMLCARSSAQVSWRTSGSERPRRTRPVPRMVFFRWRNAVSMV